MIHLGPVAQRFCEFKSSCHGLQGITHFPKSPFSFCSLSFTFFLSLVFFIIYFKKLLWIWMSLKILCNSFLSVWIQRGAILNQDGEDTERFKITLIYYSDFKAALIWGFLRTPEQRDY